MAQAQNAPRPAGSGGFRIVAFPREFERNVWDELDRRFYIILLSALAVVYGIVIFMANIEYSEESIQEAILERYVTQIYEAPPSVVEDVAGSSSTVGAEEEPQPQEEPDVREQRDVGKPAEARGETKVESGARRRGESAAREGQRTAAASQAGGIGVFEELSAADGVGVGDAVYDVGDGSEGGMGDLDAVLNNVSGLATVSSSERTSRLGARTGKGSVKGRAGVDDLLTGSVGPAEAVSLETQGDFAIAAPEDISGDAAASGGRSADDISRVMNQHKDAVIDCYRKEARLDPSLKGSVRIKFTITPTGRVVQPAIINSTIRNRNIEQCILRRIRRWRFPRIAGDKGNVTVKQNFIFTS